MPTAMHLYSEHNRLRIECEGDSRVIWVRSSCWGETISLDLSASDRAQMRAALDVADQNDKDKEGETK